MVCPRRTDRFVCTAHGEVLEVGCRASFCEVCGPKQAWAKALMLAYVDPQRLVTLTRAPEAWTDRRLAVKRWLQILRRRGDTYEIGWTTERTKKGAPHIHALQKGDRIDQRQLQLAWESATRQRMAIVDVRAIRGAKGAAGYAMKESMTVASYALKDATDVESRRDALRDNGGRLVHVTRGFLDGRTQADVRREMTREEGHEWVRLSA